MYSSINKPDRRELLFKIIAISIPFLFLVLLEIVLRISHYGNDFSLFVNDPDKPGNVINNENISKRFFLNLLDAPKSYVQSFRREKPADTYRIFILGESSSLGFPYTHRGSFPRMLEFLLHKAYPDKDFEVINLSITAINSFALLSFGDEIVKMAPDAILIYTGHNEYYGAMGAGSSNRLGYNRNLIRLAISLRKFRVVQLAFNLADKFRKTHPAEEQKNDAGLMQKMAGEQEIAFGSQIYYRGLTQFEENMDELLGKFHKHNIPVFLSDIVSNEKDQKPFVSKLSGVTDSTAFLNEYHKGVELFNSAQFNEALSCFSKANNFDSTFAMSQFLTGEILYGQGDYSKARQCFKNAKELDELRFRAPDAINGIIKKLSLKFDNIHFVNTSQEFIANSSDGIPDNKLFIDHLHPNLSGNFLISKVFFDTLTKTGVFGASAYRISPDSLKHEIPVTAVDSVYGALVVLFMKEEWPFFEPARYDRDKPKSYPEKLAVMMFLKRIKWEQAMDSLFRFYSDNRNTGEAVKVAEALNYEHPGKWNILDGLGNLFVDKKDFKEALYYYKKAFSYGHKPEMAKKMVVVLLQLDELETAKKYLNFILGINPDDHFCARLIKIINETSFYKKRYLEEPGNILVTNTLANNYLQMGNVETAGKYVELSLNINGKDKQALNIRMNIIGSLKKTLN